MPSATGPAAEPDESNPTADEPAYEQARAELREIVAALESGGQSLEESLQLWERGEHLADICKHWLDDASQRLDAAIAEHDSD